MRGRPKVVKNVVKALLTAEAVIFLNEIASGNRVETHSQKVMATRLSFRQGRDSLPSHAQMGCQQLDQDVEVLEETFGLVYQPFDRCHMFRRNKLHQSSRPKEMLQNMIICLQWIATRG